ncbi:MAG: putative AlkP superfamily phosphohydrolase/phosphomutase, partial [Candidatus Paceibacteria bacterium]
MPDVVAPYCGGGKAGMVPPSARNGEATSLMHRSLTALRRFSPVLLLLTLLSALLAFASPSEPAPPAAADGRVIVLGFDGGDYATAARFSADGKMPNIKGLSEAGTFAPLGTTYSAESPVAWAALNTGQNPSKTGVPGFVKRALLDRGEEVSTGGRPSPMVGHQRTETRLVADMDTGPLIGFLAKYDLNTLMGLVAGAVFLAFLLAFKLVLRLKMVPSAILAILLGAVGGFGVRQAKQYIPESIPNVVANPVEVDAFWDIAAREGSRAVIIDAAMAWDRPHVEGTQVLGGLGLPDCRGDNGQWFLYTTSEDELDKAPVGRSSPTAGTVFRLPAWRNDRIESAVYGPVNFYESGRIQKEIDAIDERLKPSSGTGWKEGTKLRERKKELDAQLSSGARAEVPLVLEKRAGGAKISIGGQTQDLDTGVWSDWFEIGFELNPLIKAHAVTRVKILENDETFALFMNTLDIDPQDPQFWQPVSQPASFSKDLARRIGGPFETFGWACATMPFKDKVIDAVTMLEDIEFTMKWREKLTRDALEKGDFDCLMAVFSTPDRVQHMCYQFYDPEHPLYDEAKASQKMTFFGKEIELREAIPVIYEQIDRIIGWVQDEYLQPNDTLVVCADHGFQTFRHQVHLNNWLEQEGYLKVTAGLTSTRRNAMLMFVDWKETRAYAMGLGMIYLNLKGREADGIVDPAESRALLEEIAGKLTLLTDERGGTSVPVVEQVVFIDDVHDGPFRDREGDLMVGFKPTYRVSWGTTSGGIDLEKRDGQVVAAPIFEPNMSNWSGGHVSVAPKHVAGIFASNRKVQIPEGGVHLLHIAPTTLQLL